MANDQGATELRAWSAFCGLTDGHPAVSALADASQLWVTPPGAFLIEQGAEETHFVLICTGIARAVRYTPNGHEIWLADFGPGDLLGEIAALTGQPRTSAVIARSEVVQVRIANTLVIDLMRQHGDIALAVARVTAARLGLTSTQLAGLITMPVAARLHHELVQMGERDPSDPETYIVRPALTVSALAERIHASREATSRALKSLEDRGLVIKSRRQWTVIAPGDAWR